MVIKYNFCNSVCGTGAPVLESERWVFKSRLWQTYIKKPRIIRVLEDDLKTDWSCPRRFVFCFDLGFNFSLENFSLLWRRHHYRWRAWHFDLYSARWPLSSEGSLGCHTYCDLVYSLVISEDPWDSQPLSNVWQWSCHYLFLRSWDSKTPPSACHANALNDCSNPSTDRPKS